MCVCVCVAGAVDENGRMPFYAEECAAMLAVTFSSGGRKLRSIVGQTKTHTHTHTHTPHTTHHTHTHTHRSTRMMIRLKECMNIGTGNNRKALRPPKMQDFRISI